MTKVLFYFGYKSSGHHLYYGGMIQTDQAAKIVNANPHLFKCLDAVFPPQTKAYQETGLYNDCVVHPVRIVAWWDRSGDDRGGSNSALIGYGYSSAEEMIDDAYKEYPTVMNRQKRPVPFNIENT